MTQLNAQKTVNTQALVDLIKVFNLSKIRNVFFINEHSSSPDQASQTFVYKGIQALTFAQQYKGLKGGCAVSTVLQWKSVPKKCPVNTIRLGTDRDTGKPCVHTQSLYAYNRAFSVVATSLGNPNLTNLSKQEQNLFLDWIDFRLGKPVHDRNHRLSVVTVNSILQLAESFLSYSVELIND